MNKRRLIWAVVLGVGLSFVWVDNLVGHRESFYISPNPEGKYTESKEEGSFGVEIREVGNGMLGVFIEPRWRFEHKFVGAILAFLLGSYFYRPPEKKQEVVEDDGDSPPVEDPNYEVLRGI